LVATQNTDALARFSTSFDTFGRVDGVVLGNSEFSPSAFGYVVASHAALQVTADGKMLLPGDPSRPSSPRLLNGDTRVWSGASAPGQPASQNCTDWFKSSNDTALVARAENDVGATTQETATCDLQLHLFCLQAP
jgi:hypothetical protein